MYKQILLLALSGIVGSQAALAQVPGEGMCAIVTAVERNSRGSVNQVCFNKVYEAWMNFPPGCKDNNMRDAWMPYAGADDAAGEAAGKYYIQKTAVPIGPPWRGLVADKGTSKLVVNGDFCMVIKVKPPLRCDLWSGAHCEDNPSIEKMVCRPATGTGYNGCNSMDWLGWQSRK